MSNFPGKGKVAVIKTAPDSILEDIEALLRLGGIESSLPKSASISLKIKLSGNTWYPTASTTPWQLEGVIHALQKAGYRDISRTYNLFDAINPNLAEINNKHKRITDKYQIPCIDLCDKKQEFIQVQPRANPFLILDEIYPDGVFIPKILAGKNLGQPYPLTFEARGRTLTFDGFLKVYQDPPDPDAEPEENPVLPPLVEGAALRLVGWLPVECQTQAPPRFTEASLVRELEKLGIGRPSTYAGMVQTLKQRGYVTLKNKRLVPSDSGVALCDYLTAHFPDLFAAGYTAHLENTLDAVAGGRAARVDVLRAFWADFTPQLHAAGQAVQVTRPQLTLTGETCPICGGDLVERSGKHGKFTGCANYPDCGYTRGLEHKPVTLHGAGVRG
jgi:hypothetical protein